MTKGKEVFKMPNAVKITGRTSSITNSFVNGIIPVIKPTNEEILEALKILEMDQDNVCCAYCGDPMTEWDHFRPLVINKQPTGYITEIHNLVPACSKCNQSKGNSEWEVWMRGTAMQSPTSRNLPDIEHRIHLLHNYEKWGAPTYPIKINIKEIIGEEKWNKHWENCNSIKKMMHDSQSLSNQIQNELKESINKTSLKHLKTSIKKDEAKNYDPKSDAFQEDRIAIIVKNRFINLLQTKDFSEEEMKSLCDKKYSKDTFGVQFPVLVELSTSEDYKKRYDEKGRSRYYAKEYYIKGKMYLLTSEWLEKSKGKLTEWIKTIECRK